MLLTANDLTLPNIPSSVGTGLAVDRLRLDQRLFMLPAIVTLTRETVPASLDELVIQHFSGAREELDKSDKDYLHVLSSPPTKLQRGQKLSYPIEVLAKHNKLTFKLESGPAGMTVSDEGMLTWQTPADFAPSSALAIVAISDDSGSELTHSINLSDSVSTAGRLAQPKVASGPRE